MATIRAVSSKVRAIADEATNIGGGHGTGSEAPVFAKSLRGSLSLALRSLCFSRQRLRHLLCLKSFSELLVVGLVGQGGGLELIGDIFLAILPGGRRSPGRPLRPTNRHHPTIHSRPRTRLPGSACGSWPNLDGDARAAGRPTASEEQPRSLHSQGSSWFNRMSRFSSGKSPEA